MIDLYDFVSALNEASNEDDIINPSSSGYATNIVLQSWKLKKGQRFITNVVLGQMGAGLPYSIGAALATGKRVLHIEGDGGFQLNIHELETVRRLNLPIIMFIINNNGYHSIRTTQMKHFGRLTGADNTSGLTLPDLSCVIPAYGISYFYMSKNLKKCYFSYFEEEGGTITEKYDLRVILSIRRPVVVEVMGDHAQQYRNRVERKFINGKWITA